MARAAAAAKNFIAWRRHGVAASETSRNRRGIVASRNKRRARHGISAS
jgi:hypothetical protein